MAEIIDFKFEPVEYPDIDSMDAQQLRDFLRELRSRIAVLDTQEPKKMDSEEYEAWGDAHEELEDLIDEVLDRLEELE